MKIINADKFKENILSGLYIFCKENKEDIARAIDDEPALSVHDIILSSSYLNKYPVYSFDPIPNYYIMRIDTECILLECPHCKGRIISTAFSYAVGNQGYAFCPYCGEDLRKGD